MSADIPWSKDRPTKPGRYLTRREVDGGVDHGVADIVARPGSYGLTPQRMALYVDYAPGKGILLGSSAFDRVQWAPEPLERFRERLIEAVDGIEHQVRTYLVTGGDTEDQSQLLCCINRTHRLKAAINGIDISDLKPNPDANPD